MRCRAFMGILSVVLLAVLLGLLVHPAAALSVEELLATPDRFDQKDVALTGKAEDVHPRTSRRGNEYTTFKLADGTGRINVFIWGKLSITPGDQVNVRGIFQRVKRVGKYTFRNEVEASSVKRVR